METLLVLPASILVQSSPSFVVESAQASSVAGPVMIALGFVVVSVLIVCFMFFAPRARCPKCGATRRARFCSVCGTQQPD